MRAMGVDPATTAPEEMRAQIDKAIHEVDQGKGVLVLVDMFGGTPSNLSLSFLDEGRELGAMTAALRVDDVRAVRVSERFHRRKRRRGTAGAGVDDETRLHAQCSSCAGANGR